MQRENRGGPRVGAGRIPLKENEKKKGAKIYITDKVKDAILTYGTGKNFSDKAVELINSEIQKRKKI
ncbi:hypothetical protein [Crassaminicella profunda]|uniref:hypothetical protein n=1 Tax=Crassaminicella profunda TaxID=1286698 RepID=UPI001CA75256|nr:hypothetical protein [Crassaminicella profunda]QZY55965.1 hypothetical protein K7H06_02805 [Crassaminicella profunda]